MRHLPEPRSQNGCSTCRTARCCVVFDPELTGADLARLTELGLHPDDIADLRPVHAALAGPDAIHLGDARTWDLRLRRTSAPAHPSPDPTLDPRRCGFLVTLGEGRARCGVYAHRPLACRLFPSDLTRFGVMVLTPEAICPPDAFAQERADLPTLHTLHLIARAERFAFRHFLATFNRLPLAGPDPSRRARFFDALLAHTRALGPIGPSDDTDPAWEGRLSASLAISLPEASP
jgi:Fe-S-cluster containining protein